MLEPPMWWKGVSLDNFSDTFGSKDADLFVDVIQKGVGGPSALLLNVEGGTAIEVHVHGAACSEGVATAMLPVP